MQPALTVALTCGPHRQILLRKSRRSLVCSPRLPERHPRCTPLSLLASPRSQFPMNAFLFFLLLSLSHSSLQSRRGCSSALTQAPGSFRPPEKSEAGNHATTVYKPEQPTPTEALLSWGTITQSGQPSNPSCVQICTYGPGPLRARTPGGPSCVQICTHGPLPRRSPRPV